MAKVEIQVRSCCCCGLSLSSVFIALYTLVNLFLIIIYFYVFLKLLIIWAKSYIITICLLFQYIIFNSYCSSYAVILQFNFIICLFLML